MAWPFRLKTSAALFSAVSPCMFIRIIDHKRLLAINSRRFLVPFHVGFSLKLTDPESERIEKMIAQRNNIMVKMSRRAVGHNAGRAHESAFAYLLSPTVKQNSDHAQIDTQRSWLLFNWSWSSIDVVLYIRATWRLYKEAARNEKRKTGFFSIIEWAFASFTVRTNSWFRICSTGVVPIRNVFRNSLTTYPLICMLHYGLAVAIVRNCAR